MFWGEELSDCFSQYSCFISRKGPDVLRLGNKRWHMSLHNHIDDYVPSGAW